MGSSEGERLRDDEREQAYEAVALGHWPARASSSRGGIDFFRWYRDKYDHIPGWLTIIRLERAERVVREPELFVLATAAQLAAASTVAFLSRKSERWTRVFRTSRG